MEILKYGGRKLGKTSHLVTSNFFLFFFLRIISHEQPPDKSSFANTSITGWQQISQSTDRTIPTVQLLFLKEKNSSGLCIMQPYLLQSSKILEDFHKQNKKVKPFINFYKVTFGQGIRVYMRHFWRDWTREIGFSSHSFSRICKACVSFHW